MSKMEAQTLTSHPMTNLQNLINQAIDEWNKEGTDFAKGTDWKVRLKYSEVDKAIEKMRGIKPIEPTIYYHTTTNSYPMICVGGIDGKNECRFATQEDIDAHEALKSRTKQVDSLTKGKV